MSKKYGMILSGMGAGTVTGLFGAGGGMVLVPLLTALTHIQDKQVFPSSIAIILPICLTSIAMTAAAGLLDIAEAVPYLLGSALGGVLAGIWGKHIPAAWLHRGLGILILWGGFRYLC